MQPPVLTLYQISGMCPDGDGCFMPYEWKNYIESAIDAVKKHYGWEDNEGGFHMIKTIGANVRRRRVELGQTQAQAAAAYGLSRRSLQRVELGQRELSAGELAVIAHAQKKRLDWYTQPRGVCRLRVKSRRAGSGQVSP